MKQIYSLITFILIFGTPLLGEQPSPPQEETPEKWAQEQLHTLRSQSTNNDRFMAEFFHMLFVLGIIIGALLVLTWFLKRFANTRIQNLNVSSNVKVIERRVLGPKAIIWLLEVHGKELVVGESSQGFHKLAEFDSSKISKDHEETAGV